MDKIKLKENEVLLDGMVMTLEELGIGKITTYAEQRAQQLFYNLHTDIQKLDESDYQPGHMGFPGEHIDKIPSEMKKSANILVNKTSREFDKLLEGNVKCTDNLLD